MKILILFLTMYSVFGQRLGSDPKTWSPSVKRLTCDQCVSVVNRTETALSYNACRGLPDDEKTVCSDLVNIALDKFSPDVVCQEIGYCPKKVWMWISF